MLCGVTTALHVAVCQLDNREDHREQALAALARHVAETRADLVVLPELPFSAWLAVSREPDLVAWQAGVEQHDAGIARLPELGAAAVVGSRPTVEPDGLRHNAAFVWTPDEGAVRLRDKRHLPDEPGYWEASWYDRGEASTATRDVLGATLGVLLCTDLWFFEQARAYARAGTELLCLPRATPYTSLQKWLAGGQVAAMCAGAYCLSSNQWDPSGAGVDSGGLGWVVGPDGDVLATTPPDEPFVTVEVDLEVARAAKQTYPRYVLE
jgi:N-carbamoylputrescine amidase